MSNETAMTSAHQDIPSIKILPAQVARLKKEEEEETWISGEELYTEGSSDEENCRCKARLSDTAKNSCLTLAKPYRSKSKADKRTKNTQSQETFTEDKASLSIQSTSKGHDSRKNSVSNEEEYIADDQISWKVNREFTLDEELMSLEEHQQEYLGICDSMDSIFEDYLNKLSSLEDIENENFARQNDKFKDEVKDTVEFLDSAIENLHKEIECIKRKTQETQLQNRLRLKEIIAQSPPQSKKLAKNTKSFIELYPDSESTNLSDNTSYKTLKNLKKSESIIFPQVTMKSKELEVSNSFKEDISDINSELILSDI